MLQPAFHLLYTNIIGVWEKSEKSHFTWKKWLFLYELFIKRFVTNVPKDDI